MGSFKDFFHDKKGFYLSEQEKINLQALSNFCAKENTRVAMITRSDGARGLAVVYEDRIGASDFNASDILSPIMEGKNKRIKEIHAWLGTIYMQDFFPVKKKKGILKQVKEKIIGENNDAWKRTRWFKGKI